MVKAAKPSSKTRLALLRGEHRYLRASERTEKPYVSPAALKKIRGQRRRVAQEYAGARGWKKPKPRKK